MTGIRQQVHETHSANQELVGDLEKITEAVAAVRASLNAIAASSEESRRAAAEIVQLNQTASAGAQNVAHTSGNVASAAKQIAGLTEDSAAAIEEQSATMELLQSACPVCRRSWTASSESSRPDSSETPLCHVYGGG